MENYERMIEKAKEAIIDSRKAVYVVPFLVMETSFEKFQA